MFKKKIKNKNKYFFNIGLIFILSMALMFIFTKVVNAESGFWGSIWSGAGGEDTVTFLTKYKDYLSEGNFITGVLHSLGWGVVKLLYICTSYIEKLIPDTFNLLNFLDYAGVQGITRAIIDDLVVALMVLTLVYLGFKTVIAKEPPKFKDMGVNIFISAFLILGMPTLMNTMQDISVKFYNDTQTGINNEQASGLSWSLIQDNTTDLLYISSIGFSALENNSSSKNNLTPDSLYYSNLNALITPDTIKDVEGEEIKHLGYRLDIDEKGNAIADKIEGGAFGFFTDNFDEGYFRYHVNFIPIIVGLVALFVAYIFTLFVLITTIIEIGFKRIVGLFVFATDLESGQRTKMVVQDILNAFMLIAFTGLSLKMYTFVLTFLAESKPNWLIYIIAIVAATFVLIKGSNTIMRYFGVDVGLKDGFAQMAGAFAFGKTMSDLAQKPFNKGKGKDKKGQNSERDRLSKDGEDIKSINNDGADEAKKSVNTQGKTIGSMKERSLKGMTEDTVKGVNQKITNGNKDIKDRFKDGIEDGTSIGQSNNEKWHGKVKPIDEMGVSTIENDSSKAKDNQKKDSNNISINDSDKNQGGIGPTSAIETRKQRLEQELNTVNPNTSEKATRRITDVVEGDKSSSDTKTKLNQEITPKNIEANGNIKMSGNGEKSINQDVHPGQIGNTTTRQTVNQDVQQGVAIGHESAQRIKQQVDRVGYSNAEQVKQKIIQEVQQSALGNTEAKQRVVQEIEKSSVATPQQVQQNVQQVLQSARVPQQVNDVVQRVIQDVQPGTNNIADVKAKVIQELEQTSFGSKEPIKQAIIQNVEKGFSATPEQLKQNIQQVIQTTEAQNVVEEKTNNKKSGYFGSLFGESLDEYEEKTETKNKSRFDFIKGA